jgi:thiol-disulfide isomerase/thioredoxin
MRRTIATTAAVAAAALVLTACGTGDDDTSTASSATTEAVETAPATPEPPADEEPAETTAADEEAGDEQASDEAAEEVAVPAALDFDAPTVDGGTFSGATLVGQDSVLYFWAPWCTVCRAEAPSLPGVANEFDGQATFYGVAGLSPDVAAMQGFVSDTGTGDLTHIADTEGSIYTGFGVSSQTTFAFVNDDGTIEIVRGPLTVDDLRARTQALIDS